MWRYIVIDVVRDWCYFAQLTQDYVSLEQLSPFALSKRDIHEAIVCKTLTISCLFESLERCDSLNHDRFVKFTWWDRLGDNAKVHDLDKNKHNNQSVWLVQQLIGAEHTLIARQRDTIVNGIGATATESSPGSGGKILILHQHEVV